MNINGTLFNYLHICHRKLWLFANGINMEPESELVQEGKLIHESTYPQRANRCQEVEIAGIKVDYYDSVNNIIHEIKKSNKIEDAHIWQLKYYLYQFRNHGITDAKGILEYPTLRKTQQVTLSLEDITQIEKKEQEIAQIISTDTCPKVISKPYCRNCSYYDFCRINEPEQ